jgi:hypothetical protein
MDRSNERGAQSFGRGGARPRWLDEVPTRASVGDGGFRLEANPSFVPASKHGVVPKRSLSIQKPSYPSLYTGGSARGRHLPAVEPRPLFSSSCRECRARARAKGEPMHDEPHAIERRFCRLACAGRLDEVRTLVESHPDLLQRSVHCASAWGNARAVVRPSRTGRVSRQRLAGERLVAVDARVAFAPRPARRAGGAALRAALARGRCRRERMDPGGRASRRSPHRARCSGRGHGQRRPLPRPTGSGSPCQRRRQPVHRRGLAHRSRSPRSFTTARSSDKPPMRWLPSCGAMAGRSNPATVPDS